MIAVSKAPVSNLCVELNISYHRNVDRGKQDAAILMCFNYCYG